MDIIISSPSIFKQWLFHPSNYILQHGKNTFVRVKYINDEFIYLEMPLQTQGNFILATSLGMFGAIGGAARPLVETNIPVNYRPIIIYKENNEAFIIKDCEQFNKHFESKDQYKEIDCNKEFNFNTIRQKIVSDL